MTRPPIDALEPCPFCNGTKATPKLEELHNGEWRVTCYGCHVYTFPDKKKQVIKEWNTRAAIQSLPNEISEGDELYLRGYRQGCADTKQFYANLTKETK